MDIVVVELCDGSRLRVFEILLDCDLRVRVRKGRATRSAIVSLGRLILH